MSIPSPCTGLCRIDEASGFCIGCARTKQEIKVWGEADATVLARIWSALPERRSRLGLGMYRLGWTRDDLHAFVAGTMKPEAGTWVFGIFGAVGEFCIGRNESVGLEIDHTLILAQTSRGAIRFEITEELRALAFSTREPQGIEAIVLAVPRGRSGLPPNWGLTSLGPDLGAIGTRSQGEALYDLGLGSESTRFCIRTAEQGLACALDVRLGWPWPRLLADLGGPILEAAPSRVISSSIGRLEVFTPIPLPGGQSPDGPHTHFLPTHIAADRETPPGMDLPSSLRPAAIFYPAAGNQLNIKSTLPNC